jgi:replication factor A1
MTAIGMDRSASLLSVLVEKSGLSNEEVMKRVEEKKESLGHFVNDDVAVRLVAKDLEIKLHEEAINKPSIKIEDLVVGINNVTLDLTVIHCSGLKEFQKKDGSTGKMVRVAVSDETGRINMVMWDEHSQHASEMTEGTKIKILSAYTREGLDGKVEIHLGNRASVQIFTPESDNPTLASKGRIEKVYDPIYFRRRDGSEGRFIAFLLKGTSGQTRVLVWNPTDEMIMSLVEGASTEIVNGALKKDLQGEAELHVNDEMDVIIDLNDVVPVKCEYVRLEEIQPDMKDITIQGVVECDFELESSFNGKPYARVLLKDGETVLPIIFWNGQAVKVKQFSKPGCALVVEGCNTRFGKSGLEVTVNKWCKIRAK